MIANDLNKNLVDPVVENEFIRELGERIVRVFLDIFVLRKLSESCEPPSGYDFIKLVTDEFDGVLSAGSIYAVLYGMERDGLIQGESIFRKRVYVLTIKGEETIKKISEENGKILYSFGRLFV